MPAGVTRRRAPNSPSGAHSSGGPANIAGVEPLERSRDYVRRRLPGARPHTHEEMFLRLLHHGVHAREAGNYGIAAACVVRHGGRELVCFGASTLFSDRDPSGHAEMNALRNANHLARASDADREAMLSKGTGFLLRDAPHVRSETLLYSTLEPCPMCTVAIVNAGVDEVVVGCADEFAGALLRLDTLAPLWAELVAARHMAVHLLGPDEVPGELLGQLRSLFFETKDPLDRDLQRGGVLPHARLGELASRRRP